MKIKQIILTLTLLFILAGPSEGVDSVWWKLPSLPAPNVYGNILIDRTSSQSGVKPVTFSHWSHRTKYTCRVCHFELEFSMELNSTEITEKLNRYGRYCGACHNDTIAFGHTEKNCKKCHNGNKSYGKRKFKKLANLPSATNGNEIDWVKALDEGLISPETYVLEETKPLKFERELSIESPWAGIAPVSFPHAVHGKWLDCSNCHPEIFNIREYGTEDLQMEAILESEFCGVCHSTVAFPPKGNCKRCHVKMKTPGRAGNQRH